MQKTPFTESICARVVLDPVVCSSLALKASVEGEEERPCKNLNHAARVAGRQASPQALVLQSVLGAVGLPPLVSRSRSPHTDGQGAGRWMTLCLRSSRKFGRTFPLYVWLCDNSDPG